VAPELCNVLTIARARAPAARERKRVRTILETVLTPYAFPDDTMTTKTRFRFPLVAIFFLMFYVVGLFTGLAYHWSKERFYKRSVREGRTALEELNKQVKRLLSENAALKKAELEH
jgi:hypothetical protein